MNRSTKYAYILPKGGKEASGSQLDEDVTKLWHPSPDHEPSSESQSGLLHMEMSEAGPEQYEYQYVYQPVDEGLDSFPLSSPLTLEAECWNDDELSELELGKSSVSGVSRDELYDFEDNKDNLKLSNDTFPDSNPPKDIPQIPHLNRMSVSNGFQSLYDATPPSQSNLLEIYKFDQLGRQLRNDRLNPRSNQDLRCYMQAPLWAAEPTGGGGITRYMASCSKTYDPFKSIATFNNQSEDGQGEISVSRISGLGWLNKHRTYFTINLSKQFALKKYRSVSGSREKTRKDRSSSLSPVITTALSWSFIRFIQVHGTPSGEDGQWTGERLDDQIDSILPILYLGTARILEAWNQVRIHDEELIISKIDGKNVDASRRVAREKAEGRYVPTKRSIFYEDDEKAKEAEEQGEGQEEMEVS